MGNITEIRENGELYAKYTYDTIGRLVREDNKKLGKTTVFTYDTNGNILCRKEYAFTLFETEKLDELDCDTFTYTYDGDKLLSYNGEECTYDAIGNPEKYRGLDADFDNGRQLKQLGDTTFTYDNLGRRISKKIPKDDGTTETITFTYDANGNLIRQSNGISFIYDASGVCGISHGNSTYFYRKDILGNIVAILDANGEIVAKYTYDAWGNYTITDTNGNVITDENHIANLNPFRYRGYYYDVETGLYFLKTRYYDPEIGRFITIDDIEYLDPSSINGLNLYCYCFNNPILYVDPSGHMPEWVMWFIGGVLLVGSIVLTIATGGAAAGTIVATVHTIATGAMIGGITSAAIGTLAGGITFENGVASWDWSGAAEGFMWGSITGVISGAAGSSLSNVGKSFSIMGKFKNLCYAGTQGLINSTIASCLTAIQGLITGSFSWDSVGLSFAFGFAGGSIGITKFGEGIKNIFVGIGLGLGETSIGEIIEWIQSKQQTQTANLRLAYLL